MKTVLSPEHCCFVCEHCGAVDDDLCCFLASDNALHGCEVDPVKVEMHHVCEDYQASILAGNILFDAENLGEMYETSKPKPKPIPQFLKAL